MKILNLIKSKISFIKLNRKINTNYPLIISKENVILNNISNILRNELPQKCLNEKSTIKKNYYIILNQFHLELSKIEILKINLKTKISKANFDAVIRNKIMLENQRNDIVHYLECHPQEEVFEIFIHFFLNKDKLLGRYLNWKVFKIVDKYLLGKEGYNKANLITYEIFFPYVNYFRLINRLQNYIKSGNNLKINSRNKMRKLKRLPSGLSLINYIISEFQINRGNKMQFSNEWLIIKRSYYTLRDSLSLDENIIINSLILLHDCGSPIFHSVQIKFINEKLKDYRDNYKDTKRIILNEDDFILLLFFYKFLLKLNEIKHEELEFESNYNKLYYKPNMFQTLLTSEYFNKNSIKIIHGIYDYLKSCDNVSDLYKLKIDIFFIQMLTNKSLMNQQSLEFTRILNINIEKIIAYLNHHKEILQKLKKEKIISPNESLYVCKTNHIVIHSIMKTFKILNANGDKKYLQSFLTQLCDKKIISSLFFNDKEIKYFNKIHKALLETSEKYRSEYNDWKEWGNCHN
jgi:hypothetical protein